MYMHIDVHRHIHIWGAACRVTLGSAGSAFLSGAFFIFPVDVFLEGARWTGHPLSTTYVYCELHPRNVHTYVQQCLFLYLVCTRPNSIPLHTHVHVHLYVPWVLASQSVSPLPLPQVPGVLRVDQVNAFRRRHVRTRSFAQTIADPGSLLHVL